jgi:hypothetical protein
MTLAVPSTNAPADAHQLVESYLDEHPPGANVCHIIDPARVGNLCGRPGLAVPLDYADPDPCTCKRPRCPDCKAAAE